MQVCGWQLKMVTSRSSNCAKSVGQLILTKLCGWQLKMVTSRSSSCVENTGQLILTRRCMKQPVEVTSRSSSYVENGATDFDEAMREAVCNGHIEIVKLCREYGATDFDEAMYEAACEGHVDIVKLFRDWIGFEAIHHDLLRHHHKREFSRRIHDELLPIAWHPN